MSCHSAKPQAQDERLRLADCMTHAHLEMERRGVHIDWGWSLEDGISVRAQPIGLRDDVDQVRDDDAAAAAM